MNHYSFFTNRECEFFPCHQDVAPEDFNCLFCFCPLYSLGERCGGDFVYQANGIKDCTQCAFPHKRENYSAVTERYADIVAVMAAKACCDHDGKEKEHGTLPQPV